MSILLERALNILVKQKSSAFLLQILSNFQECARGQGKFDIEWNETCVADGACTRSCYL